MKRIFRIMIAALCLALTFGALVACDGASDTDGGDDIFAIEYNGVKVSLDDKADKVIKELGEPASKQSTGNCGGLGETVRYDYSAFVMVVVEYDSGAKVDSIELKNDLVETTKGIYIGSSQSAVETAYGEPDETVKSTLIYSEGDKELSISITDGSVSAIVFRCV